MALRYGFDLFGQEHDESRQDSGDTVTTELRAVAVDRLVEQIAKVAPSGAERSCEDKARPEEQDRTPVNCPRAFDPPLTLGGALHRARELHPELLSIKHGGLGRLTRGSRFWIEFLARNVTRRCSHWLKPAGRFYVMQDGRIADGPFKTQEQADVAKADIEAGPPRELAKVEIDHGLHKGAVGYWILFDGEPVIPCGSPVPRWAGESLDKKNVLIWNELWQGLGDSILFLRYAYRLAERAKREDGLIAFVSLPRAWITKLSLGEAVGVDSLYWARGTLYHDNFGETASSPDRDCNFRT